MTISPLSVPVGASLTVESWTLVPGFRTAEQFETVRSIVESPDFAFSCGSQGFQPDGTCDKYKGPFVFTWYDKQGRLHCTRILPKRGISVDHCVGPMLASNKAEGKVYS